MDNLLSAEQIKLEATNNEDVAQRYHLINGRLISVDSEANQLLESFSTIDDLRLTTQDVLNSVYSDVPEEVTPVLDEEDTIGGDSNDVMVQLMDIRTSLSKLRSMLEQRIGTDLSEYEFWLQDSKKLEINKTLVDQCINRAGLVQVNVQIRPSQKRINIVDVLKPDEYISMDENDKFGYDRPQEQESVEMTVESNNPLKMEESQTSIQNVHMQEEAPHTEEQLPTGTMAKWVVDENFRGDQKRLHIPQDPKLWTVVQVKHWIQWAVRQFKLSGIKLSDWSITGKELCALSLFDFKKKCPSDPGDLFWTHLELMKKCGVVAIMQTEEDPVEGMESSMLTENPSAIRKKPKLTPISVNRSSNQPVTLMSAGTNRSGNNGQIQLWQFLLELLTSTEHTSVIQWIGSSGEFKLQDPAVVARLWGKRKHKPTMNYEKLSRALRYYYDGDMISKVHGKRFVYRFVCDLKQLIGYDAGELAKLVSKSAPAQSSSWQME